MSNPFRNISTGRPRPGEFDDDAPAPDWDRVAAGYAARQMGSDDTPPVPATRRVPREQQRQYKPMSPGEIDRHASLLDWHFICTPVEVEEVRETLYDAVDAAHESADSYRALEGEEARERQQAEAAVQRAVEAGEPLPEVHFTDWSAERMRREVVDRHRREQLRAARQRYDAVVEELRPGWVARIGEEVQRRHETAREALAAAEGPILAWDSLARQFDYLTGPEPELRPEDFIDEAKSLMDPRHHAFAFRKAVELMEEAKAERHEERNRKHGAPGGLDRIRAALES